MQINGQTQVKANTITSGQVDSSVLVASGANALTGNLNAGNNRVTNVANGSNPNDVVTLAQVQALLAGLSFLLAVQAMTTGAETYTIASGSVTQISGTTVDGVTLAVGDRVLIKNAPSASGTGTADASNAGTANAPNGVYVVTANTTNLTVTRDATSETPMSGSVNPAGKSVFAEAGTSNKGAGYIVLNPTTPDTAFTYGTTVMQWGKFNAAGGSVTTVSVASANGLAGTVTNPSTTPSITLSTTVTGLVKGNGTGLSAATPGTDYMAPSDFVFNETPTGTVNGTNTGFSLANTPLAGSLMLHQNGILLEPGVDFTLSSTTITMASAPATGDRLRAYYQK